MSARSVAAVLTQAEQDALHRSFDDYALLQNLTASTSVIISLLVRAGFGTERISVSDVQRCARASAVGQGRLTRDAFFDIAMQLKGITAKRALQAHAAASEMISGAGQSGDFFSDFFSPKRREEITDAELDIQAWYSLSRVAHRSDGNVPLSVLRSLEAETGARIVGALPHDSDVATVTESVVPLPTLMSAVTPTHAPVDEDEVNVGNASEDEGTLTPELEGSFTNHALRIEPSAADIPPPAAEFQMLLEEATTRGTSENGDSSAARDRETHTAASDDPDTDDMFLRTVKSLTVTARMVHVVSALRTASKGQMHRTQSQREAPKELTVMQRVESAVAKGRTAALRLRDKTDKFCLDQEAIHNMTLAARARSASGRRRSSLSPGADELLHDLDPPKPPADRRIITEFGVVDAVVKIGTKILPATLAHYRRLTGTPRTVLRSPTQHSSEHSTTPRRFRGFHSSEPVTPVVAISPSPRTQRSMQKHIQHIYWGRLSKMVYTPEPVRPPRRPTATPSVASSRPRPPSASRSAEPFGPTPFARVALRRPSGLNYAAQCVKRCCNEALYE